MPATDGYGQAVQYPVLSDAPNMENAFQTAVNGIVSHSVLRFANSNERSATLTGQFKAVPGMISYLIAEDRWDRFDGDKVWRPMTPGAWKPLTFASGYTAFGGSPGYRIVNGSVELRGAFQRTSGSNFTQDSEIYAFTLPTEARPSTARSFVASATYNGGGHSARLVARTDGAVVYIIGHSANFIYLDSVRYSLD
ncbi:hypothetical protein [Streptomyces fulvorobeus]|uniref:Uncharacterized protein n=1 Tax=Streptomyces fulvorobeus TaxID=284028 RepID=A0A7J0CDX5_9ACTN|nr:hypothetical protein [Streptomyces fulvorobeus]NYE44207.1 hypothetical protein [Streptomyces fulvorobeus]GFN00721.1 hypothetical protein Sfulv_55310 [Streptomyces fulvorobeus]